MSVSFVTSVRLPARVRNFIPGTFMKTRSETPYPVKTGHSTRKSKYVFMLPVKLICQKRKIKVLSFTEMVSVCYESREGMNAMRTHIYVTLNTHLCYATRALHTLFKSPSHATVAKKSRELIYPFTQEFRNTFSSHNAAQSYCHIR